VVSLSTTTLVVICLALGALVAVGARLVLRALIGGDRAGVVAVAGPLMPALGAAFALLSAISLSNEAAELRDAEHEVAAEAGGSSRLAWSSTTPGVDTEAVQQSLLTYLRSTRSEEWEGSGDTGDPDTFVALGDLEGIVRAEASAAELGSAQAGEMLGALDTVTSTRRERLATRAHQLPVLYLVVVGASGLALVINSAALALDRDQHVAWLTAGLVVVVSLVLALLLAITSPFRGGFIADGAPLDAVIVDLEAGDLTS
jgi:hypothetical protein